MSIVVSIPGPLGRWLNQSRRRLEPEDSGRLPPHIPLVAPFPAQPPFLALERHCWRVCHEIAPFWVELGQLAVDEGEHTLVAEIASGREAILSLREALLMGEDAPPDDGPAYEPRAFIACLEQPRDVALARSEASAPLPSPAFFLERIELMAQYADGGWYERDFYTLDRAAARARW